MSKLSASVALDYQLTSRFKAVRDQLLSLDAFDQWNQPVAFWARTTDRHLPIALVDKTLRYLVDTPLERLAQTPGVGPKKLNSLIMLMRRAVESKSGPVDGTVPVNGAAVANGAAPANRGAPWCDKASHLSDSAAGLGLVEPWAISEAAWTEWRATIRTQRLEKEPLGRFAVSLQSLPKAMWRKPLECYLLLSLREIRGLKSHGEKRLAALMDILGRLHTLILQVEAQPHLSARIEPRLSAHLDAWFASNFTNAVLDDRAVRQGLLEPLIEQVTIDLGEQAANILREWLIHRRASVQQVARHLGLARGRVYDIISEAAVAVAVRWPQGRQRCLQLRERLVGRPEATAALWQIEAAIGLLFSDRDVESDGEPQSAERPLGLPLADYATTGDAVYVSPRPVSFILAEVDG